MNHNESISERDRDRALRMLRSLTALGGIGSLIVAALGMSAAARASAPAAAAGTPHPAINSVPGSLSPEQLAALNFALPRPSTIVIWQTPGRAPAPSTGGHAPAPAPGVMPAPGAPPAPAPAPAPRPAPTPPPPPVATTGTS